MQDLSERSACSRVFYKLHWNHCGKQVQIFPTWPTHCHNYHPNHYRLLATLRVRCNKRKDTYIHDHISYLGLVCDSGTVITITYMRKWVMHFPKSTQQLAETETEFRSCALHGTRSSISDYRKMILLYSRHTNTSP